jgi:hypothetical protein
MSKTSGSTRPRQAVRDRIGQVLEALGTYTLIVAVAGSVYLIVLLIIQLLVPRLEPAFAAEGQ